MDNKNYKSTQVARLNFTENSLKVPQQREMERLTQITKKTLGEHFDDVAANYDAIMDRVGYPDPEKVSEAVHQLS